MVNSSTIEDNRFIQNGNNKFINSSNNDDFYDDFFDDFFDE